VGILVAIVLGASAGATGLGLARWAAPGAAGAESTTPDAAVVVTGQILQATGGMPVSGATVWANGLEAVTNAEGRFRLGPLATGTPLLVKAPGYARLPVRAMPDPLVIRLPVHTVKAAYLSYFGVGDTRIRGRVLDLIDRTELNAVVIDVKGDRGLIPYRTSVALALEAGAQGPVMLQDIDGLLADLHRRGAYVIARIVAFKDPILAGHRPDLAVMDGDTGRLWLDNERLAWVDPFREETWEYLSAIAA